MNINAKHPTLLQAEEGKKWCFRESKTQMTKEDKRRMHTSRSAMCSIQTVKYLHIPHTLRAPRTSLVFFKKVEITKQAMSLSCFIAFILP